MAELPQDPWLLLELDRATATERDVKRAYARLIKIYRPDADAARFQQVHDAYQYALHVLRQEPESATEADLSAESPAAEEPERFVVPEDFGSALAELQFCLANPQHASLDAALAKVRNLAVARADLLPVWEHALLTLLGNTPQVLAPLLAEEDIFLLLTHGHVDLANLAVQEWHRSGLTQRLVQLATRCADQRPPLEATGVVVLQLRLAMLLAFINLPLAERLTNQFYTVLPAATRDQVMPHVEERLSAAKLFAPLPLENRRFWESKMFRVEDAASSWDADEVRPFYQEACRRCPPSWPGFALFGQLLPPRLLASLGPLPVVSQTRRREATTRAKPQTQVSFKALWFLIFIVGRGLMTCERSHPPIIQSPTFTADKVFSDAEPAKSLTNYLTAKEFLEKDPLYRRWTAAGQPQPVPTTLASRVTALREYERQMKLYPPTKPPPAPPQR